MTLLLRFSQFDPKDVRSGCVEAGCNNNLRTLRIIAFTLLILFSLFLVNDVVNKPPKKDLFLLNAKFEISERHYLSPGVAGIENYLPLLLLVLYFSHD